MYYRLDLLFGIPIDLKVNNTEMSKVEKTFDAYEFRYYKLSKDKLKDLINTCLDNEEKNLESLKTICSNHYIQTLNSAPKTGVYQINTRKIVPNGPILEFLKKDESDGIYKGILPDLANPQKVTKSMALYAENKYGIVFVDSYERAKSLSSLYTENNKKNYLDVISKLKSVANII